MLLKKRPDPSDMGKGEPQKTPQIQIEKQLPGLCLLSTIILHTAGASCVNWEYWKVLRWPEYQTIDNIQYSYLTYPQQVTCVNSLRLSSFLFYLQKTTFLKIRKIAKPNRAEQELTDIIFHHFLMQKYPTSTTWRKKMIKYQQFLIFC